VSAYLTGAIFVTLMVAVLTAAAYWGRKRARETIAKAEEEIGRILRDAQKDAENLKKEAVLESKEKDYNLRADFEKHTRDRRQELSSLEARLSQKETGLDRRSQNIENKETELVEREKLLDQLEADTKRTRREYEEQLQEQRSRLERLAGLTAEDAKRQLIKGLEQEARRDAANMVRRIEEDSPGATSWSPFNAPRPITPRRPPSRWSTFPTMT
jgi:ribonuclease Y